MAGPVLGCGPALTMPDAGVGIQMIRSSEVPEFRSISNRILLVAHDDGTAQLLRQSLAARGLNDVETVTDGRRVLPAFRETRPDVVLLDAGIEPFDAAAVLRQIGARVPRDEFLPFVVLAPMFDVPPVREALDTSVATFFQDPGRPGEIALLVRELMSLRQRCFDLAASARRHIIAVNRLEVELADHLARSAELKDHPSSGHVFRVGQLSAVIARAMGLDSDLTGLIGLAAPLHDIGKVGIPDAILLKEEPLSLDEMDVVKTHTTIGASLLAGASTPLFQLAEEIALYHHENWDGTGYTPGLERDAIPLAARIVRVADAFDSMTRTRPFAPQHRRDNARDFIRSQVGQSFDPQVVAAFLEAEEQVGDGVDEVARNMI